MTDMKIGVLTAMDKEFRLVSELAGSDPNIVVRASGIGKVNAAVAAYRLIAEDKVDAIINTGCAGGVDPTVAIGDVVIGSACAYHDVWCGVENEAGQIQGLPVLFDAEPALLRKVAAEFGADPKVHIGTICTGDQFLETADDDARVKSVRPDALACDMEATAIAQVCYLNGDVPFIAYKVISDVHYDSDKAIQMYDNFWSNLAEESFEILKRLFKVLA